MKPAPPVTRAFTADHPIVSLPSAQAQYLPCRRGRSFADEQAELLSFPNDDPRLIDYVTAVRRRWATALVVMLLVIAVAAAYSAVRPVGDEATALIGLGAGEDSAVPWLDPLDPAEEVGILTGAAVEESVHERLGRVPEVTAQQLGDAALISVTVGDGDAEMAAAAANAYASAYIEERNAMRRERLETIHASLEATVAAIDRRTTEGEGDAVDPETVAALRLAADLLGTAATSGQLAEIEIAAAQLQEAARAGATGDALAAVRRTQIEQLADMASVGMEAIEAFGPQLLDPAVSDGSSSAGVVRALVAAAVAGLLLGVVAAVVRDATDPKVRDAGDVEVGEDTPVVDLREAPSDGMGRLRSIVLLAFPDGGAVQLLAASTADASVVASALAASLEHAGLTVEVRETTPAQERATSGTATPRRFETELRNGASPETFLLVPCAPLGADPDGYLVAAAVDATLLVVAADRDRREAVRHATQEVRFARGKPVLGIVLTDSQTA